MVQSTDIRREQRRKRRRRQRLLRRAMFAAAGGLVAAAVLLVVWNALPASADTRPTSAEALPDPRPAGAGNGIVVAIDPGHGGYNENNGCWDSGAKGNGVTEAELTMRIAGMLEQLLRQDRRFAPVMTTDGRTYLKGSQRGTGGGRGTAGVHPLQLRPCLRFTRAGMLSRHPGHGNQRRQPAAGGGHHRGLCRDRPAAAGRERHPLPVL